MNKLAKIFIVVIICVAVGYFSGIVTRASIETWYPTLIKPSFNPPNWIFAPVWTLLYMMMGVAGGLIWSKSDIDKNLVKTALWRFAMQLNLNALWSYLFFGLHSPMLAGMEIVLLWVMIFATYKQFAKIDNTAAYLMLPYLTWVSFAMILNANIWWLNR